MDDNFPRCFDYFVINYLSGVYQCELEGGSLVSDTHFILLHRRKYPSPRLEVSFLRLHWEVGGLGERLMSIIP